MATPQKTPKDYEALNRKLMVALVTLTSTFMLLAFLLYILLGR